MVRGSFEGVKKNLAYSKCYRALELYADSIGMRVVMALQNLQESGAHNVDGALTIMATIHQRQRHLDQDPLRLASKRPPQLPPYL